jgi:hypothetical protein
LPGICSCKSGDVDEDVEKYFNKIIPMTLEATNANKIRQIMQRKKIQICLDNSGDKKFKLKYPENIYGTSCFLHFKDNHTNTYQKPNTFDCIISFFEFHRFILTKYKERPDQLLKIFAKLYFDTSTMTTKPQYYLLQLFSTGEIENNLQLPGDETLQRLEKDATTIIVGDKKDNIILSKFN